MNNAAVRAPVPLPSNATDKPLTQADRVLGFAPVDNPAPKYLTSAQIDQYNRLGYIKNLRIFDHTAVERNRALFDRLLAQFRASGRDSYAINGFHTSCASLYDLVLTPAICDYVQDLLGDNFVCWGTHYFCKLPNDGKAVSWHQDAPYWPLTPSRTVTAWLAIDDADEGNAALRIIPGSHLHGEVRHRDSREEENNILFRTIDDADVRGEPLSMDLRAGEISLHNDLIVHGSKANVSDRRRCGLTMRFVPVGVRSYGGWNANSIWCRGSDPSGHWANIPRPDGDRPPVHPVKGNAGG